MPIPENRRSIERALAEHLRRHTRGMAVKQRKLAEMELHMARMREAMPAEQFARAQEQFLKAVNRIGFHFRNRKRRDDGSMPALVEPPRGPAPRSGGAAAALEFDD
jgi:hypothetical protein